MIPPRPTTEVERELSILLKLEKSYGPDEFPVLSKLDEEALIKVLVALLRETWSEECIPLSWSELLIVLIFKKETCGNWSNHREVSLIQIVTSFIRDTTAPSDTNS